MCDVAPLNSALKEAFEHHERCRNYFSLESWNTYPSFDAHEKIFDAIKAKDAVNAEKYLSENRISAAERYRNKIENMM